MLAMPISDRPGMLDKLMSAAVLKLNIFKIFMEKAKTKASAKNKIETRNNEGFTPVLPFSFISKYSKNNIKNTKNKKEIKLKSDEKKAVYAKDSG